MDRPAAEYVTDKKKTAGNKSGTAADVWATEPNKRASDDVPRGAGAPSGFEASISTQKPLSSRVSGSPPRSTDPGRIDSSEVCLPTSSKNSLLHETAKVVAFMHNDLSRICRIDPNRHTTAESNCLALFLKLAKSVKVLRAEQGDAESAFESETFSDQVTQSQGGAASAGVAQHGSHAQRGVGSEPWQKRPYHKEAWNPPAEFYGVDSTEPPPSGWTNAVEEMRTMRYNLKRSGKAQTSVLEPGARKAMPRAYGGPHHNYNPSHPGEDDPRGNTKPCFKRAEAPDSLMESVQATLAELRDQERSIVCKEQRDTNTRSEPEVVKNERWYEDSGPDFHKDMHTYMKSLNTNKWSSKDEEQLQSVLAKTGLDLSQKTADVMKRPNTRSRPVRS